MAKKQHTGERTFSDRVVELALSIPKGKVTTYGAIARAAGGGGQAARSISAILDRAWHAGEHNIPFHRIVYAEGRVWMSPQYAKKRMKLYKQEKIAVDKKGRIENFRDTLFEFK
jgi:methylated-DNA-protein-cysteine methyltransferase-like protein